MCDPEEDCILKARLTLCYKLESKEEIFKAVYIPRLFSLQAVLNYVYEFSEVLEEELRRMLALDTNLKFSRKCKKKALL